MGKKNKYIFFQSLEKENKKFEKEINDFSEIFNNKYRVFNPIVKKLRKILSSHKDLENFLNQKLFYPVPDVKQEELKDTKNKFNVFAEEWDKPEMDIYNVEYGPL